MFHAYNKLTDVVGHDIFAPIHDNFSDEIARYCSYEVTALF
jgi:hypothetical protein